MRAMDGRVEGAAEIQEIRVFGDWAYCWNQITVTIRTNAGGPPHQLSGPALSIFRKNPGGAWVVVRDANMITPVQTST
jgi:ketosteroid isomerase-like protein